MVTKEAKPRILAGHARKHALSRRELSSPAVPRELPMDQLWAPWRLSYVATAKPPTAADGCFICKGLGEQDDRRSLIALRTPRSVVILNRFPYNNGHLLIAPRAHKGGLDDL